MSTSKPAIVLQPTIFAISATYLVYSLFGRLGWLIIREYPDRFSQYCCISAFLSVIVYYFLPNRNDWTRFWLSFLYALLLLTSLAGFIMAAVPEDDVRLKKKIASLEEEYKDEVTMLPFIRLVGWGSHRYSDTQRAHKPNGTVQYCKVLPACFQPLNEATHISLMVCCLLALILAIMFDLNLAQALSRQLIGVDEIPEALGALKSVFQGTPLAPSGASGFMAPPEGGSATTGAASNASDRAQSAAREIPAYFITMKEQSKKSIQKSRKTQGASAGPSDSAGGGESGSEQQTAAATLVEGGSGANQTLPIRAKKQKSVKIIEPSDQSGADGGGESNASEAPAPAKAQKKKTVKSLGKSKSKKKPKSAKRGR